METLQITKRQARDCIDYRQYAEDIARRCNNEQLKDRSTWDNSLKQIDGKWQYFFENKNGIYRFTLENHAVQTQYIDGQEVSLGYLEGFLNDLSLKEQKDFLQNMSIEPIEKYISNMVGFPVTFFRYYDNEIMTMTLKTPNIVSKAGCCKAMLSELYIETFGKVHFYIDQITGEQNIDFPSIHFSYKHKTGGTNGSEIGRVKYNLSKDEFQGYNYETEQYEVI